ncbi:Protein of unknown function [Cotesia congregata]|uniref:Uncharacterized protein n=1 Tax=Cotesia congregata TaxID=51543 RepID=A0A8J2EFN2_COTCN|nr:Protein of unknown function [Cotesia congregata]
MGKISFWTLRMIESSMSNSSTSYLVKCWINVISKLNFGDRSNTLISESNSKSNDSLLR